VANFLIIHFVDSFLIKIISYSIVVNFSSIFFVNFSVIFRKIFNHISTEFSKIAKFKKVVSDVGGAAGVMRQKTKSTDQCVLMMMRHYSILPSL
jgi:hypothetical protein